MRFHREIREALVSAGLDFKETPRGFDVGDIGISADSRSCHVTVETQAILNGSRSMCMTRHFKGRGWVKEMIKFVASPPGLPIRRADGSVSAEAVQFDRRYIPLPRWRNAAGQMRFIRGDGQLVLRWTAWDHHEELL